MVPTYRDRIQGTIFGQAIGDALGHPIEFSKTHVVKTLEPGNLFTDDTQMFCAIGEALLEAPPHRVDEPTFMEALAKRFTDWRQNPLGGSHRAPGGTCMEACRRLGTGIPWDQSGIRAQGKGNGTAMRSAVVGAMYWKAPEFAFRIGGLSAVPTHNNLEAILGAAIVSSTVAYLIAGTSYQDALASSLRLASDWRDPFLVPLYPLDVPVGSGQDEQSPWYAVGHVSAAAIQGFDPDTSIEAFRKVNGNDGAVIPAVAAAMFWNSRGGTYPHIVLDAVNNSDDCDTVGAIAGAIAGARFGYSNILIEWLRRIELRDYLQDLGSRIWTESQEVKPYEGKTDPDVEVEF